MINHYIESAIARITYLPSTEPLERKIAVVAQEIEKESYQGKLPPEEAEQLLTALSIIRTFPNLILWSKL